MSTRREFLLTTAGAASGALLLAATPAAAARQAAGAKPASRKLKLLILGGTGFIGPWQVRYAVERGHEVTIFNRGRSAPGALKGVEELTGDRAANTLDALKGRKWDAVIDNSASRADAPDWVRNSAGLLKDAADQYLFVSTISVFSDMSKVPGTIHAPLFTKQTTPGWSEGKPYPYGLAKALAEAEATNAFGSRTTIVRPGLIVGPGDDTDRFTYWPVRIERGGEILAPGDPQNDRVQVIDVRDLSEWIIRLCEHRTYGTFIGTGPQNGRSMAEFLYGIAAVTTTPLSWTWVPREFLATHGVRPFQEMPVWLPPLPGYEAFNRFDLTREVAAGLTFRPLADTARATLEFHHQRPAAEQKLRTGISPEKETEVLKAWHTRK